MGVGRTALGFSPVKVHGFSAGSMCSDFKSLCLFVSCCRFPGEKMWGAHLEESTCPWIDQQRSRRQEHATKVWPPRASPKEGRLLWAKQQPQNALIDPRGSCNQNPFLILSCLLSVTDTGSGVPTLPSVLPIPGHEPGSPAPFRCSDSQWLLCYVPEFPVGVNSSCPQLSLALSFILS